MKLCFSIDGLSASGDHAWRLQEDLQHWRSCSFAEDLRTGDARPVNRTDVEQWPGRRLKPDKELGLIAKARPGMFDFFMRGVFAHVIVHRFTPAPIPAREQLVQLLRESEPGTPWLIHLDLAGHFRMLDTCREKIIGNTEIAVRGEIASSSDHVGEKAAADEVYADEIYRQFLAGWCLHLVSRRLGVFVPDLEKVGDEPSLRQDIMDWKPE